MVLLLARPFGIGDHIRIRSGALGEIFEPPGASSRGAGTGGPARAMGPVRSMDPVLPRRPAQTHERTLRQGNGQDYLRRAP